MLTIITAILVWLLVIAFILRFFSVSKEIETPIFDGDDTFQKFTSLQEPYKNNSLQASALIGAWHQSIQQLHEVMENEENLTSADTLMCEIKYAMDESIHALEEIINRGVEEN